MQTTTKTKRNFIGAIPRDVEYTLVEISHGDLFDSVGIHCDNCGKGIVNIATIKNNRGIMFNVGLDCLKTITTDYAKLLEVEQAEETFKQANQYKNKFKKYLKLILDNDLSNSGLMLRLFLHNGYNEIKNKMTLKFDLIEFEDDKNYFKQAGAGWVKLGFIDKDNNYYTIYNRQVPKEHFNNVYVPIFNSLKPLVELASEKLSSFYNSSIEVK